MVDRLIDLALRFRAMVVLAAIGVIGVGIYEYRRMPVDAFPDISPIMVPIFAEGHGMAPEEMERLVTFPIESAMNGLPGVTEIKSTSAFGMAVVYVYFRDNVDVYFARQLVNERLTSAMADLPEMDEPPTLGPISTGLGQILIYYLTLDEGADTDGKDPNTYLRDVNDWIVKYQLQTVSGVTDILSIGGHVLQYQVRVIPDAMLQYDVSVENLVDAIRNNNRNAGGQYIVLGSEESLVRGLGLLHDVGDIGQIPLKVHRGVPVTISDVAEVALGSETRRGVVTRNGEKEVVSGMVLKLFGENTSDVINRLYKKIETVQESLPDGVHIVPYYEQADLVERATWTVKKSLLIGASLVLLTLLVFLGNLRAALIVALALPICALIAIICMGIKGVSANLMSLGGIAIAIGMLGDGAIVMVENIHRSMHKRSEASGDRNYLILKAAKQVGRPITWSVAIIIIMFLPIFTLEGVEGRMFSPMAFTITFALLGSIVTALMLTPVLASFLLWKHVQEEIFVVRLLERVYRSVLNRAIRLTAVVLPGAATAFVLGMFFLSRLGTEFIPTLEEGSILIGTVMTPSISLDKATQTVMAVERRILSEFPEVEETVSRIGRPEAGSHPHPVNYAEIHLELKPQSQWQRFKSKGALVESLSETLSSWPGVQFNFTQPIQNAFDELLSGIKAQLAVMLFGEDTTVLNEKATEIAGAIEDIPGLVDLAVEQSFGQPQVQVVSDREACARYGIDVDRILEIVEVAVGGEVVDHLYQNTRRYGIHVRYEEACRRDPEAIRNILVHTDDGSLVPLSQVADVREVVGPVQVNRENNQRRWVVQGNARGRDLGSIIRDIEQRVQERVDLPPGYYLEFGGQFENQRRAMRRLSIIVPVMIGAILLMLWISFGSLGHALIIIVNVPLALIGGVFGLYLMDEYLSVPASVGFIALFGIAVQNGMVLVSCIRGLRQEGRPLRDAVVEGSVLRLRPVLMTAVTTILGLLPLLLSHGTGSEVQRPLAVVVVFGLASSTALTLLVIPSAYVVLGELRGKGRLVS